MATATIDELEIQIESDSNDASAAIDRLTQSLERLVNPVSTLTSSGSGLSKLSKQMEKLSASVAGIQNLTGFEKVTQAVNALKSLDSLTGVADVSSYVKAINKLAGVGNSLAAISQFPDVTAQLSSLAGALNSLQGVQGIRLNGITNSLSQLPQIIAAINGMPAIDTARIRALANALAPLSRFNTGGTNSFVRAVNRIPAAAQQINQIDFTQFSQNVQQLTNSLQPLVEVAERAGSGLTAIAQIMQSTQRNVNSMGRLGNSLGNLSLKSLFSWASLMKLRSVLVRCFEASSQFVENLNLFNVTMGKSADTAMEFAEKVNDALGIDISDWTRYQGFFQSVGKGFGVVSEKADLMSKNLTQLTYDISSFYNLSVDEAYNKVQSGFAGELEPLRRLGFALDEATLKQVAFNHGITQSYESMTQAQKSQLRYVAMIEQAKNIGVTGDMSRTIDTAANGVRVLQARVQQFSRAVGNMLMPALSAILPYLTAFIQVVTEGANALADMFGFELPKINLDGITNGYDDITAATEEATAATEKFKGSLAGVDQLNIIGSKNTTGGTGANQYDINIDLPEYDFLNGVESKTKQIAENMKQWFMDALPWIEAVGAALAGFTISQGLIYGIKALATLKTAMAGLSSKIAPVSIALAAGAASGTLLYNSMKKIVKGEGGIPELAGGLTVAVGAIAAFAALGNPVGAAITAIAAGVGLLAGAIQGANEEIAEQNRKITDSILYNNGGEKVSEIAGAFEDWAGAATRLNRQTLDKYSQLDEYDTKISETLQTMEDIAGIDFDFENITPADAEALKEPFEQLCDYLNNEYQDRISTAAQDMKGIFENLGIDLALRSQFEGAFKDLNLIFDNNLSESQKTVTEYFNAISAGKTVSAEQTAKALSDYDYILGIAKLEDTSYQDVQSALKNLEQFDFTNIDLENDTTAKEAVQKVTDAANAYKTSQWELLNSELNNLVKLKDRADYDYSENRMTDEQYKAATDLLGAYEVLAKSNYNNNINEIKDYQSRIYTSIESKIGEAAKQVIPNVGDWYISHLAMVQLANIDLSSDEIAQTLAEANFINGHTAAESLKEGWNDYYSYNELSTEGIMNQDNIYYDALAAAGYIQENVKVEIPVTFDTSGLDKDLIESAARAAMPQSVSFYNGETSPGSYSNQEDVLSQIDFGSIPNSSSQPKTGYARETIERSIGDFLPSSGEQDFVVNTTVNLTAELDGETVAETVNKYNNRIIRQVNGR